MRHESREWPQNWSGWVEKDNICITQRLVPPRDRPARFWDYHDFSAFANGTNYEWVSSPKSFLEWIAVKCPELIEKGGKIVGFTTDKVSKMRINYYSSKAIPFETQFEEQFVKFEDGKFLGGYRNSAC